MKPSIKHKSLRRAVVATGAAAAMAMGGMSAAFASETETVAVAPEPGVVVVDVPEIADTAATELDADDADAPIATPPIAEVPVAVVTLPAEIDAADDAPEVEQELDAPEVSAETPAATLPAEIPAAESALSESPAEAADAAPRTAAAEIIGDHKLGATLAVQHNLVANNNQRVAYQWSRDGQIVSADATFKVTAADEGATITVRVFVVNNGGNEVPGQGGATVSVAMPTDPAVKATITPGGLITFGSTLAVDLQADQDLGAPQVSVRWENPEFGIPLTAEADGTLVVPASLAGFNVRAIVTVTGDFGFSGAAQTVSNVRWINPNMDLAVAVAGDAQLGGQLTATWDDLDGVLAEPQVQWTRQTMNGWVEIPGATSATLPMTADLASMTVRAEVTGTFGTRGRATGVSQQRWISNTAPIAVTISGMPVVGSTLVAEFDDLGGDLHSESVQWTRQTMNGWVEIPGAASATLEVTPELATMTVRAEVSGRFGTHGWASGASRQQWITGAGLSGNTPEVDLALPELDAVAPATPEVDLVLPELGAVSPNTPGADLSTPELGAVSPNTPGALVVPPAPGTVTPATPAAPAAPTTVANNDDDEAAALSDDDVTDDDGASPSEGDAIAQTEDAVTTAAPEAPTAGGQTAIEAAANGSQGLGTQVWVGLGTAAAFAGGLVAMLLRRRQSEAAQA